MSNSFKKLDLDLETRKGLAALRYPIRSTTVQYWINELEHKEYEELKLLAKEAVSSLKEAKRVNNIATQAYFKAKKIILDYFLRVNVRIKQ